MGSEYLMFALEKTGNGHGIPRGDTRRANPADLPAEDISLQSILANYMLSTEGVLETSDFHFVVSDPQSCSVTAADEAYLHDKGYRQSDLVQWMWLLVAQDLHAPAQALFKSQSRTTTRPPEFIFTFVLRRERITARTLQVLLNHAWQLLDDHRTGLVELGRPTLMLIVADLLRHARHVWPEAMMNIAEIISSYLRLTPNEVFETSRAGSRHSFRLSASYNRVLTWLASPASVRPFKSSVYQEIAQFDLLHDMASHRPPIRISAEGYQAVTRVLLSRTKTGRERDWTSLQAPSWPPWKRARTGVDESKDLEYGMSRAAISIQTMIQAGYGHGLWGDIAKIYAGRDTDGSPVVQTRSIMKPVRAEEAEARKWEARIRTTRTLREAWACFLSYKETGVAPSEIVYAEMIVALLLSHKATTGMKPANIAPMVGSSGVADPGPDDLIPGDALERLPEPALPRDRIYLSTEPPSPFELFQEMLDKGMTPSETTVERILKHTLDIEDGMLYLELAGRPYIRWSKVLRFGDSPKLKIIQKVPEPFFKGFLLLLCRAPRSKLWLIHSGPHRHGTGRTIRSNQHLRRQSPALHAIHLLTLRRSKDQSLWAAVLRALSDPYAQLFFGGSAEPMERQAILKLQMMRRVLGLMKRFGVEPSIDCLTAVSVGVENAAFASHRITRPLETRPPSDWTPTLQQMSELELHKMSLDSWRGRVEDEAAEVEEQGPRFLRTLFHQIVSGEMAVSTDASASPRVDNRRPIPALLVVPSPADLHSYLRALGVLSDHEGILSLVQWMAEHHGSIWLQVLEERGGRRRWATLLTAIRVFLQSPQLDARVVKHRLAGKMKSASEDLIDLVRRAFDGMPDWQWPDEDSIWQYTKGKDGRVETETTKPPSLSDYL